MMPSPEPTTMQDTLNTNSAVSWRSIHRPHVMARRSDGVNGRLVVALYGCTKWLHFMVAGTVC